MRTLRVCVSVSDYARCSYSKKTNTKPPLSLRWGCPVSFFVSPLLEGLFIPGKVSVCVFWSCRCVCVCRPYRQKVAVCKWDKASGQKRKCQVFFFFFFFQSAPKQRSGTESRPVLLFLTVFSLACYCRLLWATGSPILLSKKFHRRPFQKNREKVEK